MTLAAEAARLQALLSEQAAELQAFADSDPEVRPWACMGVRGHAQACMGAHGRTRACMGAAWGLRGGCICAHGGCMGVRACKCSCLQATAPL